MIIMPTVITPVIVAPPVAATTAPVILAGRPQLSNGRFTRVNQFKVDFALVLVDPQQLYLDRLANLEDVVVTPPDQGHVFFDVFVEIILHRTDVDQTFHRIL